MAQPAAAAPAAPQFAMLGDPTPQRVANELANAGLFDVWFRNPVRNIVQGQGDDYEDYAREAVASARDQMGRAADTLGFNLTREESFHDVVWIIPDCRGLPAVAGIQDIPLAIAELAANFMVFTLFVRRTNTNVVIFEAVQVHDASDAPPINPPLRMMVTVPEILQGYFAFEGFKDAWPISAASSILWKIRSRKPRADGPATDASPSRASPAGGPRRWSVHGGPSWPQSDAVDGRGSSIASEGQIFFTKRVED